jgi:hypothetical protein
MDSNTSFAPTDAFGGMGTSYYTPGASSPSNPNNYTLGGMGSSYLNPGSPASDVSASQFGSPGTSGGMSTGNMIGWGLGVLGTGMAAKSAFGGGGPNVNLDPYGTGAQAAGEAQMLWKRYNTGEIMPADQAKISQWRQSQTQAVKDYYKKAGLEDSSMAQEALGQVGKQADDMIAQSNQNLLQPAMQATGMANQYAQQLVQYQIAQDQQKQAAQAGFMQTIATLGMGLAGL